MKLYDIVKSLQNAQGSLNKQTILMQHKDNPLLKEYMRVVNSPAINMYQRKITECGQDLGSQYEFTEDTLSGLVYHLAERQITGKQAEKWLSELTAAANEEGKELIKYVIDRSIGASVGDSMVLKTWPDLYFTVPYQRCSLLDAKAKEKFSKLERFACQEKADGSFLYLMKEEGKPSQAITRTGSRYPKEFAARLAEGVPDGFVLIGELLVFTNPQYDGKMDVLNRQTANGMLNSVLKGGDIDSNFVYKMFAWDLVTVEEFYAGRSSLIYRGRWEQLKSLTAKNTIPNVEHIETTWVTSLEEAYNIYSKYTANGLEGAVIKTEDFLWKDGTSKDCVKMKVEFEIDLEITHVTEGTGKAAGMLGSVGVKTLEGGLTSDVGTGWSDDMRKYIWEIREDVPGKILALKANDIISKRGSETKSLFLPVAIEIRLDKTEADSLEQCEKILASAKGLK